MVTVATTVISPFREVTSRVRSRSSGTRLCELSARWNVKRSWRELSEMTEGLRSVEMVHGSLIPTDECLAGPCSRRPEMEVQGQAGIQ
jgi:hypothetical protein